MVKAIILRNTKTKVGKILEPERLIRKWLLIVKERNVMV